LSSTEEREAAGRRGHHFGIDRAAQDNGPKKSVAENRNRTTLSHDETEKHAPRTRDYYRRGKTMPRVLTALWCWLGIVFDVDWSCGMRTETQSYDAIKLTWTERTGPRMGSWCHLM
jgi:hypothetical protein